MPLDEFSIIFDNDTKSFTPGQSVIGRVIVSCPVETNTQGLQIKCSGQASVHWMETFRKLGSPTEAPFPFDATENYFSFEKYAVGDGKSDTRIPPGRNEYPFNFLLPKALPSSYEGTYGKVIYEVVAIIKRSWKFDKEVKESFAVHTILNLSRYPTTEEPVTRKATTELCCCCCLSGPIGFEITLSKTGFLPGESVTPNVELFNNSGRGIDKVIIYLTQRAKFSAEKQINTVSKTLVELEGPSLDPRETRTWNPVLEIPKDLTPTKLGGGCEIMDVQYAISVFLQPPASGFANMLKEEIIVIIGTVHS